MTIRYLIAAALMASACAAHADVIPAASGNGTVNGSTSEDFKTLASRNGGGAAQNNGIGQDPGAGKGLGTGFGGGNGNNKGQGQGNGLGNQSADLADPSEVPEPSSIALMLAGMLGVAGLGRRRAR